jgi:hypothetical protein
MRHHRQATITVDFMYELYHLYDEVALIKEEGKCRSKLIQCQEETTHPQPKIKPPRIFSTRIINSATKPTALQ